MGQSQNTLYIGEFSPPECQTDIKPVRAYYKDFQNNLVPFNASWDLSKFGRKEEYFFFFKLKKNALSERKYGHACFKNLTNNGNIFFS